MNALRQRWYFYQPDDEPNEYGEVDRTSAESLKPVLSGFYSREQARKPMEVSEASKNFGETQFVLIGIWNKHTEQTLKSDFLAYCPETGEVAEVMANPIDKDGTRKSIYIYVTRNIQREIDTSTLCTDYE